MSNPFLTEEKFEKEIILRDGKIIHVRKWKVKDRKKFKETIINKGENLTAKDISDVLIFPCIQEKNILLTEEEQKYISSIIREISIGETFKFSFLCDADECDNVTELELKISDVNKPKFSNWSTVEISGIPVEFGEKIKPDFYFTKLNGASTEEKQDIDLAAHILKVGDEDALTFDEIMAMLEELDSDVYDKFVEEYNKQRFVQDNVHSVKCSKCSKEQMFAFDEIAGFFPASWF